jgi:hypothetical protein
MASTTVEKSKPTETKTNGNGTHPAAQAAPAQKPPVASDEKKGDEKKGGPPAGYTKSAGQIALAGYWLPEAGPIHGKLVGAYDFRQKSGRGKGQIRRVYILDIADPCVAQMTVEDAKGKRSYQEGMAAPRDLIGVFGSAGLKDLDQPQGSFVYIERQKEQKELDNGNAMWLFDIYWKGTAKPLKVRQATEAEAVSHEDSARANSNGSGSDDELPF